jgi:hypothetical protein
VLIGLVGLKQAGKDHTAQILGEDHRFVRFAFADRLKEMALAIDPYVSTNTAGARIMPIRLTELVNRVGWETAKRYQDVRRLLQRLGKEGVRDSIDEDAWVNIVFEQVDPLLAAGMNVVVSDVRFANEADAIRRRGGLIWRIAREGQESHDEHASETEQKRIVTDLVLRNTGDERYRAIVDEAIGRFA